MLSPYLVVALSGLYWSYDWYREGLSAIAGATPPQRAGVASRQPVAERTPSPSAPLDLDVAWAAFLREAGPFESATLRSPARPGAPLLISWLPSMGSASARATRLCSTGPERAATGGTSIDYRAA